MAIEAPEKSPQPHPKPLIIYGGPLYDGKGHLYPEGSVYICDGKVRELGSEERVFSRISRDSDIEIYDTQGKIILPGLINAYQRFTPALLIGLIPSAERDRGKDFLRSIERIYDDDAVQLAALSTLLNSIRSGVTTLLHLHASPVHISGILNNLASVIKQAELNAVLGYEISDQDGEDPFIRGLEENLNFIESSNDNPRIHGCMSLYAHPTLSAEYLDRIQAVHTPGSGIMIRFDAASTDEQLRLLNRLKKASLLHTRSILITTSSLEKRGLDLLAETETALIALPHLMNLSTDLLNPQRTGLSLGFGTGGVTANLLNAGKIALYRQQSIPSLKNIDLSHSLFNMFLGENRRMAAKFFGRHIGLVTRNGPADITVLNYTPRSEIDIHNLHLHILLGMEYPEAAMVMIGGRFIYNDHTYLTLDPEIITRESRKAALRLQEKYRQQF